MPPPPPPNAASYSGPADMLPGLPGANRAPGGPRKRDVMLPPLGYTPWAGMWLGLLGQEPSGLFAYSPLRRPVLPMAYSMLAAPPPRRSSMERPPPPPPPRAPLPSPYPLPYSGCSTTLYSCGDVWSPYVMLRLVKLRGDMDDGGPPYTGLPPASMCGPLPDACPCPCTPKLMCRMAAGALLRSGALKTGDKLGRPSLAFNTLSPIIGMEPAPRKPLAPAWYGTVPWLPPPPLAI